jgi:hypothetical protein
VDLALDLSWLPLICVTLGSQASCYNKQEKALGSHKKLLFCLVDSEIFGLGFYQHEIFDR